VKVYVDKANPKKYFVDVDAAMDANVIRA